ncbi:MAG: hypothetical protein GXP26_07770 [Planctomycetes bacterium]|nr:hypothetical protein [Planctomycetota bacterium]
MIRRMMLPAMLVSTMVLASSLLAEDEKCPLCPKGAESAKAADEKCSTCPIAAAMKNLPQITYAVGEESTNCAKTAGKLAEKQGASIVYLVGKEKFEDKGKAHLALVSATEEFVDDFANPQVCKISGTTTIAGQKTECSKTAAKLTGLMADAMKSVHLTYAVGEEDCDCPLAAASLAKTSGKPKLFVVGKEKTECEVTARLNLARAKYRAMVKALAKAEKKAAADTKES